MWNKGLVIGKFYPPHAGHRFLIDTALAQVQHLTVLICDLQGQDPPASLRAQWLREIHPDADVRIIPDIGYDDDSQIWADYTRQILGYAPDVVFSSEGYGVTYAQCLGCDHVMVDSERKTVPCAGRAIRAHPYKYFQYLEPPVRAHYALRVAIVGAESTGTTTLAHDLAVEYNTAWAPEYGRLYSEAKITGDSPWQTQEFAYIAQMQNALEDQAARLANRVLFCDTNAFATAVWHERYIGSWSDEVEQISSGRNYGIYFVTGVDIPFVQDGTRDGEHLRSWMHGRFVALLTEANVNFHIVSGDRQSRMGQAKLAVDRLLGASG